MLTEQKRWSVVLAAVLGCGAHALACHRHSHTSTGRCGLADIPLRCAPSCPQHLPQGGPLCGSCISNPPSRNASSINPLHEVLSLVILSHVLIQQPSPSMQSGISFPLPSRHACILPLCKSSMTPVSAFIICSSSSPSASQAGLLWLHLGQQGTQELSLCPDTVNSPSLLVCQRQLHSGHQLARSLMRLLGHVLYSSAAHSRCHAKHAAVAYACLLTSTHGEPSGSGLGHCLCHATVQTSCAAACLRVAQCSLSNLA